MKVFFFVKHELLVPENPKFAILAIKIGNQMAKKDLLDKNRNSAPVCIDLRAKVSSVVIISKNYLNIKATLCIVHLY